MGKFPKPGWEQPASPIAAGWQSGEARIHPLAPERDALGDEQPALARTLGERAVGAHYPPPGQVGLIDLEQDRAGEAWRPGRDVSIGPHESLRDLPDAIEHFL